MMSSESIHGEADAKEALYHHHVEDTAANQQIIQAKRRKKWIIIAAIAVAVTVSIIIAVAVPLSLRKIDYSNAESHGIHSTSIGGGSPTDATSTTTTASTTTTTNQEDKDKDKDNYNAATLVTSAEKKYNPPIYAHDVSPYANLIRLKTYTPASDNRRIFVMGDIHGCLQEMNQLLEKIEFEPKYDVLVLTGDLVFRGKESVGVIQRARELQALCVRGNHDDKVVRLRTYEKEHGADAMTPPEKVLPEGNVGDPLKFKNKHVPLARELDEDDYNYLVDCPLILHIPDFNAMVVHGGLDPSIPDVEDNDPWSVMNMRHIDGDNVPSKDKLKHNSDENAKNWTTAYSNQSKDNTTVYYGHDASRGVTNDKKTIGLDSGCVYGRQLSVMEIKSQTLTQIDCTGRGKDDDKHDDNE